MSPVTSKSAKLRTPLSHKQEPSPPRPPSTQQFPRGPATTGQLRCVHPLLDRCVAAPLPHVVVVINARPVVGFLGPVSSRNPRRVRSCLVCASREAECLRASRLSCAVSSNTQTKQTKLKTKTCSWHGPLRLLHANYASSRGAPRTGTRARAALRRG